jgi:hypothetical protein
VAASKAKLLFEQTAKAAKEGGRTGAFQPLQCAQGGLKLRMGWVERAVFFGL